ncbi:MAG TPA: UMP kinase [Caldisericia bacterium]|nr:UMP kinase [Caldisericia bacterium]HNY61534.1 UMP kinase [Caldisericia bacterium]HOC79231.1 UMP kinase [Caldisericia bacterium]HOG70532.1 UMP kinase [Caldisericia bacterium]HPA65209.1 UMP kinase [Caldisericia bacterium]
MGDPAHSQLKPKYKRILLKLSGEALLGGQPYGIDIKYINDVSKILVDLHNNGVEVAIVVGGGNIWRGSAGVALGMDQVQADYMGMLATVMNGLALQTVIEKLGVPTRLQTAIAMHEIAEPFIQRRAIRHLEKGRIVIFAAGTGNPFFTSDTAAALRAAEVRADCLLKATKTDGIYTDDPAKKRDDIKKLTNISYTKILADNLRVMDGAAVSICRDNKIPIIVFSIAEPENIYKVVMGEEIGSIVEGG